MGSALDRSGCAFDPTGSSHSSPAELAVYMAPEPGRPTGERAGDKGVVLNGIFAPTAEARAQCKASVFCGATVRVLLRFSDLRGRPETANTARTPGIREMALKVLLPSGADLDIFAYSFDGRAATTANEFHDLLHAMAEGSDLVMLRPPLDESPAENQVSSRSLFAHTTVASSFAALDYFGVNAFRFIDVQAREVAVRYRLVPCGEEHVLNGINLASKGTDDLSEDIVERLSHAPIRFDWYAQVAGRGDDTCSPTARWPETRPLIMLGRIENQDLVSDPRPPDAKTLFLPENLPEGIEPGDWRIKSRHAPNSSSTRIGNDFD